MTGKFNHINNCINSKFIEGKMDFLIFKKTIQLYAIYKKFTLNIIIYIQVKSKRIENIYYASTDKKRAGETY